MTGCLSVRCSDWQLYLEHHLKPTWDWLIAVMDSTEAQLRFGQSLTETTDPAHPTHPQHSSYVRTLRERYVHVVCVFVCVCF